MISAISRAMACGSASSLGEPCGGQRRLQHWLDEGGLDPRERQARLSVAEKITTKGHRIIYNGDFFIFYEGSRALLKSLPVGLEIRGHFIVSGGALRSISDLEVSGTARIEEVLTLESVVDLRVADRVSIYRCHELTSVRKLACRVSEISECQRLLAIEALKVPVQLRIISCPSLVRLDQEIEGSESLEDSKAFSSKFCCEDVSIQFCGRLESFFKEAEMTKLAVGYCGCLVEIPKGIKVYRQLMVRGCPALEAFRDSGFTAMTSISKCHALKNIYFKDGRNLFRTGETRLFRVDIESMPWDTLPPREQISYLDLQVDLTGLLYKASDSFAVSECEWLVKYWLWTSGKQGVELHLAGWQLTPPLLGTLQRFLYRLTLTADHQRGQRLRADYAMRVARVLEDMEASPEAREDFLSIMHDGLTDCDDRVSQRFNEIEMMSRVRQAESEGKESLQKLALGIYRLHLVHQYAREHIERRRQRGEFVDEIQVFLAFESQLRDRLALPTASRRMLYASGVGLAAIHSARLKISLVLTPPKEFFDSWEPWQRFLRSSSLSWEGLPFHNLDREMDHEGYCGITLKSLSEIEKPIWVRNGSLFEFYEYEAFRKWWVQHGLLPTNRHIARIEQFFRMS